MSIQCCAERVHRGRRVGRAEVQVVVLRLGENGERSRQAADLERREALLQNPVVLEVQGITKRYGGVTAVNSVSFQLHKGEILGLFGGVDSSA